MNFAKRRRNLFQPWIYALFLPFFAMFFGFKPEAESTLSHRIEASQCVVVDSPSEYKVSDGIHDSIRVTLEEALVWMEERADKKRPLLLICHPHMQMEYVLPILELAQNMGITILHWSGQRE